MHYIGLVGKYNPIITDTRIPDRYNPDNEIDYIYPDNYCVHASEHGCLYSNDDMFTCLYVNNCPVNKR